MDLFCEKYKKKLGREKGCTHLEEYCKFREACIVNFMTRERQREERRGDDSAGERGAQEEGGQEGMDKLNFAKGDGLLPAIVQDHRSGAVLMLAYINEESWMETLKTGKAHYWSRSRNKLWLKGESSGHIQLVKEILVDCDLDTVVFRVEQIGGAACHKGYESCFFRKVAVGSFVVVGEPVFDPREVYKK
ncbi:MAG: phosphoribosyl-AMP cyclohydrolase [Desulfurivibrionaceae bacterium]|nr:phosphoribosyl-AMP cyclohydrolase [Desulfurivibrionaceae bacterium]